MNPTTIGDLIVEYTGLPPWVTIITVLVFLTVLGVYFVRYIRSTGSSAKLAIATPIVQAGVTFLIIDGVHRCFTNQLGNPTAEAWAAAVFIEAVGWIGAGMIFEHGKKPDKYGFGPGGVVFFLAQGGGAILAIIGAGFGTESLARMVIVSLGVAVWVVVLKKYTRPDPGIERLWTWNRVLETIGWAAPKSAKLIDRNVAYHAARVARAIRQSNAKWPTPWRWLARRRLVRLSESTSDEIMDLGRQRAATAHLALTQAGYDSVLMTRALATVEARAIEAAAKIAAAPSAAPVRVVSTVGAPVGAKTAAAPRVIDESGEPVEVLPAAGGVHRAEEPGAAVVAIGGQRDKDIAALRSIRAKAVELTGGAVAFTSWEQLYAEVESRQLVRRLRLELSMGGTRVRRLIQAGDDLLPITDERAA